MPNLVNTLKEIAKFSNNLPKTLLSDGTRTDNVDGTPAYIKQKQLEAQLEIEVRKTESNQ